jgi:hypothetical protein
VRKVIVAKRSEILYFLLLQKYNDKTENRIYGISERTQLLYSRIAGVRVISKRATKVESSDFWPFNS